jgi:hypothetical protein
MQYSRRETLWNELQYLYSKARVLITQRHSFDLHQDRTDMPTLTLPLTPGMLLPTLCFATGDSESKAVHES